MNKEITCIASRYLFSYLQASHAMLPRFNLDMLWHAWQETLAAGDGEAAHKSGGPDSFVFRHLEKGKSRVPGSDSGSKILACFGN